jgi:TonB family protein
MRLVTALALGLVMATGARASEPPPAAAQPAPAPAAAAPTAAAPPTQSPDLSRMKVRPKLKSGLNPEFPESEKALGHHGEVIVKGQLGVDGRVHDAHVATSSGAPSLDDVALKSAEAAEFTPALDAEGAPIAVPISLPFEFASYRTPGPGGGVLRYSCRQFALDMTWWRSAHPKSEWKDHELYSIFAGLGSMMMLKRMPVDANALKAYFDGLPRRWERAIEACRSQPERRFIDVFQPEGKYAEALAQPR